MKNQSKFIPDSISGISNNSIHFQGLNNQSLTELQSESTDHLVSEILKARAERLMKQAHQEPQYQKVQNLTQEVNIKKSSDKGSVSPIPLQSVDVKDSLTNKYQFIQGNSHHNNETVEQQKQKKLTSGISETKPLYHESNVKIIKKQLESKAQQSLETQEINVEPLTNKTTNQQEISENKLEENRSLEKKQEVKSEERIEDHFQIPKVQKIQNQSIEHSDHTDEKPQKNTAFEYLEIGMENSRQFNVKQQSFVEQHKHSLEKQKSQQEQDQSRPPEGMNAVESKITAKADSSLPEIEISQKQQLRKQTDQQVVQAITDRLNQINEIEQAELFENFSKRRQSERNPSFGFIPKAQQKPISREIAVGSQFQTEYSQDVRDVKILQHHFESNLTFLEDQLKEMIELHEALILEEECIQSRRKLKEKQMENRRYKIQLRNASYSKRFNYHSPIPKNNNIPLQFFKKFSVSPNYAGKYYETAQKIAQQKKIQEELQDEYKVFCRFYELMKNKKISSYPELPFELQYNNDLQKFAFKGSFKRSKSPTSGKKSKYEFNKAKRTVEIDQTCIQYYDLLNYKKDISRDAILEFQVFNLGRVKKLKDENKLLRKEIQFVDQQIEEVNRTIRQMTGESVSTNMLGSLQNIKSKTSFSRSPVTKTKTFYKLNNYVSPMQRVAKYNKEMSNSRNKLRLSTSKERSQPKLKLIKSSEPKEIKRLKSPIRKHDVIAEIQDDYGLSDLKKQLNRCQEIPTFGQKESEQMVLNYSESQNRVKSPSVGKKNFIQINKKLSTRTETNLVEKKEKMLIKRLDSEKLSPIKKNTKTQPSISVDQSNGYFGNLL